MRYHFTIYMTPVPKQYARVTSKGGQVWAYTPDNVIKAQRKIHDGVEGKGAWFEYYQGVKIDAIFYRNKPESSPTMRRIEDACTRRDMPVLPVIEADVDNYQKLLQDSLTEVICKDDCQITDIRCRKRFIKHGEAPRIEFWLEEDNGE